MRHGQSSHAFDGSWLNGPALQRYIEAYDAAGIAADSHPPAELVALCTRATRVVSSDLPRAIQSAERVARVPIEISPLFRESDPPLVRSRIPLPVTLWFALIQAGWQLRQRLGMDDATGVLARAAKAADWLLEGRPGSECIVVVTHGDFRSVLSRELVSRGFARTKGGLEFRTWGIWSHVDRR